MSVRPSGRLTYTMVLYTIQSTSSKTLIVKTFGSVRFSHAIDPKNITTIWQFFINIELSVHVTWCWLEFIELNYWSWSEEDVDEETHLARMLRNIVSPDNWWLLDLDEIWWLQMSLASYFLDHMKNMFNLNTTIIDRLYFIWGRWWWWWCDTYLSN